VICAYFALDSKYTVVWHFSFFSTAGTFSLKTVCVPIVQLIDQIEQPCQVMQKVLHTDALRLKKLHNRDPAAGLIVSYQRKLAAAANRPFDQ